MTTPLIAGNWKMNGLSADLSEAVALAEALKHEPVSVRVALCPPATLVERMSRAVAGSAVLVGGEDCHAEASGAFTGDISAEMLAEAGARLVIVGHSERRAGHGETDAMVAAKAVAAVRAGLEPIICVGETLAEREAGRALEVVTGQIAGSVPAALGSSAVTVAYEPVWAIGTGLTPTIAQIEEIHVAVRAALGQALGAAGGSVAILYGGSVKPSNAVEILKAAEVGGALVGGASLKAADFLGIIQGL
ncbi:MAG TPA: triose-phosphate isomerase [Caulobacteraceae bacterium]